MGDVYGLPAEQVIAALIFLIIIQFLLHVMMWTRLGKWKKKYRSMMGGAGAEKLEDAIVQLQQKLTVFERNDRVREQEVKRLNEKVAAQHGNVEIIRYNAFSEHGSDLSFSLAILNDKQDGVVLSGIHSRENAYIYAKPVQNGKSTYPLTPEEKKVIDQTAGKSVPIPTRAAQ